MTQEELRKEYASLYDRMATSGNPTYMKVFGNVMNDMMTWMISNRPAEAQEMVERLSAIKWRNYLTQKEADAIIQSMNPHAPWTRDAWKQAMEQHGYLIAEEPYYNRCALFVTMSMIYTDSIDTLKKYAGGNDIFGMIYDLALDKLTDADEHFNIRKYFEL